MTHQVGDYVEVVQAENRKDLLGLRSIIVDYKPNAVSRKSTIFKMIYYPGWRLQHEVRNDKGKLVYWRANQLKKIEPPNWEAEKNDERKEQMA